MDYPKDDSSSGTVIENEMMNAVGTTNFSSLPNTDGMKGTCSSYGLAQQSNASAVPRKGSDVSICDATADQAALSRPLLATAGYTNTPAQQIPGWPKYGCYSTESVYESRLPCAPCKCSGQPSCSQQSQGKLLLVALNATHVALSTSVASLAMSTYVVTSAAAMSFSPACFACVLFAVTGICGLYQVLRRGKRRLKCHRIAYTFLSALSGSAAAVIAAFGAKQLAVATSEAEHVPFATCAGILMVLAVLEMAVTVVACYRQSWRRPQKGSRHGLAESKLSKTYRMPRERHHRHDCSDRRQIRRTRRQREAVQALKRQLPRSTHERLALLLTLLNASHIAAGVCTMELALVGMTYTSGTDMAASTAGLFAAAMLSPTFLAAGSHGFYVVFAQKLGVRSARIAYIGICVAAVVSSLLTIGLLAAGAIVQKRSQSLQHKDSLLPLTVLESLLWLTTSIEAILGFATVIIYLLKFRMDNSHLPRHTIADG